MPEDDYLRTSNGPAHVVPTGSSSVGQQSGRYQDLLDSNPYRNLHYNQSGWQSFLSSLGFRTGYDDFREQAEINAREWDAGVMQMIQQNEYNSPAAQASRMREAGLNPDLQGLGDVSDAANPADDPNGMTPQDSSKMFHDAVASVAQFSFQAIQSTFGILKDVKAVKNLQLLNEGQQIANDNAFISGGNSLQSMISDIVFKTTSPDAVPDPKILSGSLERALSGIFTDKKMYDRASKVAQEFAAGLPQDAAAWKAWHERAGSKVGYASYAGSEGYDEDVSDAMLSFYGFIQDMRNSAEIALKSLDISDSEEKIEYNAAHDATAEAIADNAMSEARTAQANRQAQEAAIAHAINDSFEKWTTALEKKANSGGRGSMWASIALGLIGLVRLTALSGDFKPF